MRELKKQLGTEKHEEVLVELREMIDRDVQTVPRRQQTRFVMFGSQSSPSSNPRYDYINWDPNLKDYFASKLAKDLPE